MLDWDWRSPSGLGLDYVCKRLCPLRHKNGRVEPISKNKGNRGVTYGDLLAPTKRIVLCQRCGVEMERSTNSRKYCDDCRPFVRSQAWKDWLKEHPDYVPGLRLHDDVMHMHDVTCAVCGHIFQVPHRSGSGGVTRKYCSEACRLYAHAKHDSERRKRLRQRTAEAMHDRDAAESA